MHEGGANRMRVTAAGFAVYVLAPRFHVCDVDHVARFTKAASRLLVNRYPSADAAIRKAAAMWAAGWAELRWHAQPSEVAGWRSPMAWGRVKVDVDPYYAAPETLLVLRWCIDSPECMSRQEAE